MKAFFRACVLGFLMASAGAGQTVGEMRQDRDKLMERGLWKDVVTFYRMKLISVSDEGSGDDLEKAAISLGRLSAWEEYDELVETSVTAHPGNSYLLQAASDAYARA